jgi:plasmid stability protein
VAQVLVREIDEAVLAALKRRAARSGRSLQAELKHLLERAARTDVGEARRVAARIRRALAGRSHGDSADLVATDRAR